MNHTSSQHQFTASYEANSDAIFRFCLIRVSNREQALDLTQETFTRMWQTLSKGESIDNERAFLFTVAHRLIIDWYRKKKAVSLEQTMEGEDEEWYEPSDGKEYADIEMEAEGRHLLLKIDEVSVGNRQAVYLRFVEGLSPPDIANILGISTNATSVRINRGLEELRKLTGYDELQ